MDTGFRRYEGVQFVAKIFPKESTKNKTTGRFLLFLENVSHCHFEPEAGNLAVVRG